MFKHTLQPPVISLFSSSSSHPLLLSSAASTSASFAEDSWISLVDDATDELIPSQPPPSSSSATTTTTTTTLGTPSQSTMKVGSTTPSPTSTSPSATTSSSKGSISGPVLHLQSPDIKTTFIRFGDAPSNTGPSSSSSSGLAINAPYLHLFLKPLGQGMNFYLDVLVTDERGKTYVIRASTFQTTPTYTPSSPTQPYPSLLHLPLSFPPPTPHSLTPWLLLSLPLPDHLNSLPDLGGPSPPPRYKALQSIEIHANCRLKRVWCTEERGGGVVQEGMALRGMMTELCLFEAEP
ncbi:BZ3500_MvSof-1268-A1-R1_Chr3-1g05429 [Microbotryum saponariae]|uniref:BZ3500_MvSof-1268-A1-R1_Chr3-1g05429 protein n=1 Tax=Microbotryum saponariae TaxID=289078 RepID=A0A2X0LHG9_9BASI|nr:BZ3500_MvSof-1268-A1-R1_Chr3-1g05429 [Microbotryum saponariae]SDA04620.1 BZ3501_MvSof-1269-A2-R1_Chr3-1g05100 [Microbotryum saponariae]